MRAFNHYVVVNDFEYNLLKSEPARVTVACADLECSWRIHASTAEDNVTFIVRTMQQKHSCYEVYRRGNKHATKGWMADYVIGDLREWRYINNRIKERS
jgi:MuDR family transposase